MQHFSSRIYFRLNREIKFINIKIKTAQFFDIIWFEGVYVFNSFLSDILDFRTKEEFIITIRSKN